MENHQARVDAAFHALADPIRRAVLGRLVHGPASVTDLASPFAIGLPAFLKHLRVLETDGLIRSEKVGRVRTCRVQVEGLAAAESWIAQQRTIWEGRSDRLADFVETQMPRSVHDVE